MKKICLFLFVLLFFFPLFVYGEELELTETYPLSSAQAFYDSNNIANKWTICKIDFTNSSIKVARSSKK